MSFDKCRYPYNPHSYQFTEHFHHPRKLPEPLAGSQATSVLRPSLWLVLPVLKLHRNGIPFEYVAYELKHCAYSHNLEVRQHNI